MNQMQQKYFLLIISFYQSQEEVLDGKNGTHIVWM